MVKLRNAKYTKDGVLVIKDKELESFAYAQLKNYDKEYFIEPHALDVDDFVENYLHICIIYYKLSIDSSILGVTAITDGKISVINSNNKAELKIFPKGTICIDEEACNSLQRENFSIIHESFHSQFHTNVDPCVLGEKNTLTDTRLIIDGNVRTIKKKSQKDWMEHQANKYASFILMPKKFVVKLFREKRNEILKSNQRLTKFIPSRTWKLITMIAEILKVSKESLVYRLLDLKLISEEIFKSLKMIK